MTEVLQLHSPSSCSSSPFNDFPQKRHIANHSPPHQKNVIRTKFKVINICSGKLGGLVSTWTKIQPQPICRDYAHI